VADTIGPRITVSVGSVIMGLATIAFAYAPSLPWALTARFFVGFGAAFNFIALLRQQVNWFEPRHFPVLTALTVVTGNVGALFGIGPFALMIGSVGWRQAFLVTAGLTLVFAVLVALFVRDVPSGKSRSGAEHIGAGLRAIVANPTNYLTFLAFGLSSGVCLTFTGFWGIPFLTDVHHLTHLQASGCTTMMMLGVVLGCPVTPFLERALASARKSGVLMLTIAIPLWAVVIYAPLPAHSAVLLYGLFLVLGFFISGFLLPYTTVRRSNPENVMGTALAFTNTGGFISVAILQVVVGAILDRSVAGQAAAGVPVYPASAYYVGMGLLLALHVVAVIAYLLVREPGRESHVSQ